MAVLMLAVLAAGFPGYSPADTPPVNVLVKTAPVRSEALGGAGAALDGGPEMVWANPASASVGASGWGLAVGGMQGMFGETTRSGVAGYSVWGTDVFAGFSSYDAGLVTLNALDGTTRKISGQRDVMGVVSESGALGDAGRQGIQVIYMQSEMLGEFRTTVLAGSCGIRADVTDTVSAGAVVRNFGPNMRQVEDVVTLPAVGSAGIMVRSVLGEEWNAPADAPNQLRLLGDVVCGFASSKVEFLAGAELQLGGVLIIRGGGSIGEKGRVGRVSAGLGVDLGGQPDRDGVAGVRFQLDYAIKFMTESFDPPSSFSLSMVF